MSGTDRSSHVRGCGEDVAAYALGALDPAETEGFRAHLDTCIVCRDELAAFQRVVDNLPVSAPQHRAPKRLRRRVLGAVRSESIVECRHRRPTLLAGLSGPRPALALAAAVAAVTVAVGGLELGSSGASKTRVYAARVSGSTGTAQVTVTGDHAELTVHHLSPPPAGQIYEVWLTRPNQPPSPTRALFSVTANGNGDVLVPGDLHGVHQVMVTPEPAGGSSVPTHPAVIRAQLT